MSRPAEVYLRGRDGVFVADSCELTGSWVHMQGRVRRMVGANFAEPRFYAQQDLTVPAREVVRIEWQEATA